ncbi:lycopene cyclase [Stutzerimonas stutzeri]|uniref:Lycopene cyclase n=1 Tax=Stutzerimonas stutzeri TaxID=316 RepID=W8R3D6_STUST|nr:lycopene beta-cyclase CrtY [Stutzerimonas stutzeri]AHL77094.1 lycopene cyclase [Stutzerimonas stutzeri]MCQ4329974.1 lycopene beta-cyclase CrtY [Stutzerimonas stutzeri]
MADANLIFVGGGLANGLLALRLRQQRPDLRLLILEQGETLGGNHTWSFHEHDLTSAQHAWLETMVGNRWPGYEVIFPDIQRRLDSGYASIFSHRFHQHLVAELADGVRLNATVTHVEPQQVRLACGEVLQADAVIDGRGVRQTAQLALGFQKFLGQQVRLHRPHGLLQPIIMDASVAQHDGYRFVYVLPLSADSLLIEDTYYADGDAVALDTLRANIAGYASERGWGIAEVLREEQGVLPIVLSGDLPAFWDEARGVPQTGLSAALFHPTTGYSLPDAVRLADHLIALDRWDADGLFAAIRDYSLALWRQRGFFRLLNRMLFMAGPADRRWAVMQRFYRLREPLIQRFYAANLTTWDRLRIVSGKPPVPVGEALRALAAGNLHHKDKR